MTDFKYDRAVRGLATFGQFVLAGPQVTPQRPVEGAQCFHPLISFRKLRPEQIADLPAFIDTATGHQHTNLVKRKPDVLRLPYESHALDRRW